MQGLALFPPTIDIQARKSHKVTEWLIVAALPVRASNTTRRLWAASRRGVVKIHRQVAVISVTWQRSTPPLCHRSTPGLRWVVEIKDVPQSHHHHSVHSTALILILSTWTGLSIICLLAQLGFGESNFGWLIQGDLTERLLKRSRVDNPKFDSPKITLTLTSTLTIEPSQKTMTCQI